MARWFPFLFLVIIMLTAASAGARRSPPQHHHDHHHHHRHLPNFTAAFIFGDSTVDTGNNNHIITALFKADHEPYGENFPPTHKPTGRFSDGRLIPDMIASELGIKPAGTVPAYLDPSLTEEDLKTGVSFASSGTGYDELTTLMSLGIPMEKQVDMFRECVGRLRKIMGEKEANNTVGGALVIVSAGTNDFVDNFFDLITRKLEFDLSGYQDFLLEKLETLLTELYGVGGRTMLIAGVPPIGCLPVQMTAALQFPLRRRQCIQSQNSDSLSYNLKLQKLLRKLEGSLPGTKIVYANVYDPLLDMVTNPSKYGFVEARKGCCGSGLLEGGFLCSPFTPTCGNLSTQYVFFDSMHPTQKTNHFLTADLLGQFTSHF